MTCARREEREKKERERESEKEHIKLMEDSLEFLGPKS
jgi:hypothetical protein